MKTLTPELLAKLRHYLKTFWDDTTDAPISIKQSQLLALLNAADEAARLRWYKDHAQKLAGELTRRCEQVEKLRDALAPFAHDIFVAAMPSERIAFGGPIVRVGDYRRAVDALAATAPKEPAK